MAAWEQDKTGTIGETLPCTWLYEGQDKKKGSARQTLPSTRLFDGESQKLKQNTHTAQFMTA